MNKWVSGEKKRNSICLMFFLLSLTQIYCEAFLLKINGIIIFGRNFSWEFTLTNGIIIFGRNFSWEFTLTNGCFIDNWFLSRDGMNCDIIVKFFFHKKLSYQTKKIYHKKLTHQTKKLNLYHRHKKNVSFPSDIIRTSSKETYLGLTLDRHIASMWFSFRYL